MKLSDIKGERTLDVIAEIIDPVAEIASDPKAAELFGKRVLPEGMTAREFALKRLRSGVPALMKDHKKSIIAILAAINGVEPEEYAETLGFVKLFKDISELLTDEVFLGLFTSAQTEK